MEPEKTSKKSKAAKTPKASKPKKEKTPKEPTVVFAFRLSEADRDVIHRAAKSKDVSATKFVVDTIMDASRKVLDRS